MRAAFLIAPWALSCAACGGSSSTAPTGSASSAGEWYCFDTTVHVPGACAASTSGPPPAAGPSAPSATATASSSGHEVSAPAPHETSRSRDCDTDEPASRCLPTLEACQAARGGKPGRNVTFLTECKPASAAHCAESSGERVCAKTRRHWELTTRGY